MLPTVVNDLFQIEGGNVQVPQKLLEYAGAHMTTANVTQITRLPNGSYSITSRQHASTQVHSALISGFVALLCLHFVSFTGCLIWCSSLPCQCSCKNVIHKSRVTSLAHCCYISKATWYYNWYLLSSQPVKPPSVPEVMEATGAGSCSTCKTLLMAIDSDHCCVYRQLGHLLQL